MITFENVPTRYRNRLPKAQIAIPPNPVLHVSGPPNTGKTHGVCDAVYRALIESKTHKSALYMVPRNIGAWISREISQDGSKQNVIDKLERVGILVVDEFLDITSEAGGKDYSTLRDIFFNRSGLERLTVIITNQPDGTLRSTLDEAWTSRLLDGTRGLQKTIRFKPRQLDHAKIGQPWILPDPVWWDDATTCYTHKDRLISCFVPFERLKTSDEALGWLETHLGREWLDSMKAFKPNPSAASMAETAKRLLGYRYSEPGNADFEGEVV